MNVKNARRASSSYNHSFCCVISPAVARCCSRSCTDNISKCLVLYQNLQFFPISNFSIARKERTKAPEKERKHHERDTMTRQSWYAKLRRCAAPVLWCLPQQAIYFRTQARCTSRTLPSHLAATLAATLPPPALSTATARFAQTKTPRR